MPATLVKLPTEFLRGWAELAEKQQRRVQALFTAGEGATMRLITEEMEREKAAAAAAENTKEADAVKPSAKKTSSGLPAAATPVKSDKKQHKRFN